MARLNKFERETILLTSEGDKQVSVYTFNHSYNILTTTPGMSGRILQKEQKFT